MSHNIDLLEGKNPLVWVLGRSVATAWRWSRIPLTLSTTSLVGYIGLCYLTGLRDSDDMCAGVGLLILVPLFLGGVAVIGRVLGSVVGFVYGCRAVWRRIDTATLPGI